MAGDCRLCLNRTETHRSRSRLIADSQACVSSPTPARYYLALGRCARSRTRAALEAYLKAKCLSARQF
jgi:hypothetical protein